MVTGDSQQTGEQIPQDQPGNPWEPLDGPVGYDHGSHGAFDDRSHGSDPQLWLSRHAQPVTGALAIGFPGLAGLGAAPARSRR